MYKPFYGFLTFFNVNAATIQHAKIFMELNIQIIHE